jgi:hypothetical protein
MALLFMCNGVGWPSWTSMLGWLVAAPFALLYLSSRLRTAVTIGSPFARPRTISWAASLALCAFALLMVFLSIPADWSASAVTIDLTSLTVWLLSALYLVLLASVRTRADLDVRSGERAFGRKGILVPIVGVVLYLAVLPIEMLRMMAASQACPKDSVCDAPAMGFIGLITVIWLPGWIIFLTFAATTADRRGIRPWFGLEARIGTTLVGLALVALAILQAKGQAPIVLVLFYGVFGLWFLAVQYLCGQSAKRVAGGQNG